MMKKFIQKINNYYSLIPENVKHFTCISFILSILLMIFFARTIFLNLVPSAATLLQVWPVFQYENIPIQNMLFSDVTTQFEPWFIYTYTSIHHMQLPLWNPYSGTGVPFMANIQSIVFSVLAWPMYIFGISSYTMLFYYFMKLLLVGIFTYYYFREIKLNFYSSLAGAIGFMFVGFNIVWLYWPHTGEIFLLPAFLFLIEKIIERNSEKKYFVGLSILAAIGIFSGHPETFFHISFVSILYLAFRIIGLKEGLRNKVSIFIKYSAFYLIGLAISAIQLFPFVEYLSNSYILIARNTPMPSLDWHTAIVNIIPLYYGSPSIFQLIPYYVTFTNFNETTAGYVGITLLCLSIFALIAKYKDNLVKFYFLLSIWAIGVIYGLPLIYDLTVVLPVFSNSANNRLLFLLGFNIVSLGSIGLNELIENSSKYKKKSFMTFILSLLIIIGLLCILGIENHSILSTYINSNSHILLFQIVIILSSIFLILITSIIIYLIINHATLKKISIIGLLILIFLETGVFGALYEPTIDQKYFYPDVLSFSDIAQQNNQLFRATSIDPNINHFSIYPVNTQMVYGIYDIRNYDALDIKYYDQLIKNVSTGYSNWGNLYSVNKGFLDFTGVKWIFSRTDLSKSTDLSIDVNTNAIGEITNGSIIKQNFVCSKANLSAIDLLFATYNHKDIDSNITINLIDNHSEVIVKNITISPNQIKDNQWYTFSFDPLVDSENKSYTLMITSDGTPGKSATLWMNSMISDPNTQLYINSTKVSGSLCINTYYNSLNNDYILYKNYENYYVFENLNAMPRAFMIWNATFIDNDQEIMQMLYNPSFDWNISIILYGKNYTENLTPGTADVKILDYESSYIKISVNTSQPGYLVLSDSYYPGWNAYINNNETEIYRTDYAFRSIKLNAGESVIEFKYEPISFYAGAVVSLFSIIILMLIFIHTFKRK